jgi:Na+/melibiose symporter-like transporter
MKLFLIVLSLCLSVVALVVAGIPARPPDSELLLGKQDFVSAASASSDCSLVAKNLKARLADVLVEARDLVCRNWPFLFLLASFSIAIGTVWTFSSILAQVLSPFGVPEGVAGLMGAVNITFGTLVALFVSSRVDSARRYKGPFLACSLLNVTCIGALIVALTRLEPGSKAVQVACIVIYAAAGVAQLSMIPIAFEYALELSFPCRSDSVPGVLLMSGGNLAALVLLSAVSAILGSSQSSAEEAVRALWVLLLAATAGGGFALLCKEDLRRFEHEQRRMVCD